VFTPLLARLLTLWLYKSRLSARRLVTGTVRVTVRVNLATSPYGNPTVTLRSQLGLIELNPLMSDMERDVLQDLVVKCVPTLLLPGTSRDVPKFAGIIMAFLGSAFPYNYGVEGVLPIHDGWEKALTHLDAHRKALEKRIKIAKEKSQLEIINIAKEESQLEIIKSEEQQIRAQQILYDIVFSNEHPLHFAWRILPILIFWQALTSLYVCVQYVCISHSVSSIQGIIFKRRPKWRNWKSYRLQQNFNQSWQHFRTSLCAVDCQFSISISTKCIAIIFFFFFFLNTQCQTNWTIFVCD